VVATQCLNTRARGDKTLHLLIAFPPGEEPGAEVLERIEAELCAGLGLGEHQRLSAVHHDTDHLHVHVAINLIHPERRTRHEPYRAYWKLGRRCAALEVEHGLVRVQHEAQRRVGEGRARDLELHSGMESLLGWVRRECGEELRLASSWAELHARLCANGLELVPRGNGLVVRSGEGTAIRASGIGREFSKGQLEARLGPFEAAAGGARVPPVRTYVKRPLPLPNTAGLYAQYQAERAQHQSERDRAVEALRRARSQRMETAWQSNRGRRRLVRTVGRGRLAKRMLYGQARRALRTELRSIGRRYREERKRLTERSPQRSWLDWLQGRALAGDAAALAALRARRVRGRGGPTLGGPAVPNVRASVSAEHVTKRGTVVYGAALRGVRDEGERLAVTRAVTPAGLRAAVALAIERYGNRIEVNGPPEFREQVVRMAAGLGGPTLFADPALERRREALAREDREEGRERGAVQRTTGSGEGATRVRGEAERRDERFLPQTPEEAARAYITEREEKRARGIAVPRHGLYTASDAPLFYVGTRNVGGHALVLLRRAEDEILVLPLSRRAAERLPRLALGERVTVTREGIRRRARGRHR
jgi:hypothetical protein